MTQHDFGLPLVEFLWLAAESLLESLQNLFLNRAESSHIVIEVDDDFPESFPGLVFSFFGHFAEFFMPSISIFGCRFETVSDLDELGLGVVLIGSELFLYLFAT